MRILYLFSGKQRKTSVGSYVKDMAATNKREVEVVEYDMEISPDHDLMDADLRQRLLGEIREGKFHMLLVTPPCSTWSRVRGANARGPPMIRSREYPWGFPWLSRRHQRDQQLGNGLVTLMIEAVQAAQESGSRGHGTTYVFVEHPEDLGTIWREEDGKELHPASIWQLPAVRALVEQDPTGRLRTVAFCQCCFGAAYRKPTRLLTDLPAIHQWGPRSWPSFHFDGSYEGPLQQTCTCQPTTTLVRRASDQHFRTTGTATYPADMDRAIAAAIHSAPYPEKAQRRPRGVQRRQRPGGIQRTQRGLQRTQRGLPVQRVARRQRIRSSAASRAVKGGQETQRGDGSRGGAPPSRSGTKERAGACTMEGGLTSPGRWPLARRYYAVSGARGELSSEVRKLYGAWLAEVGAEKTKEIFWRMAAGKLKESPFEGSMERPRAELDEWLRARGCKPEKREGDACAEIDFRRLRAALEVMEDEDSEFLDEMAGPGVPLGVDMEMPRNEVVFEEKTKWKVEGTDEDLHEILAENYESANESETDIRRQVQEELDRDTIVKMSVEEARPSMGSAWRWRPWGLCRRSWAAPRCA